MCRHIRTKTAHDAVHSIKIKSLSKNIKNKY